MRVQTQHSAWMRVHMGASLVRGEREGHVKRHRDSAWVRVHMGAPLVLLQELEQAFQKTPRHVGVSGCACALA